LVEFSLRRAARAADTTHKVLLYHFDGVDDLINIRTSNGGSCSDSLQQTSARAERSIRTLAIMSRR
jgi:hypothetical protein